MSYLADVVEVGEERGNESDFDGTTNGATLKNICVWVNDNKVKGLKVSLTDDKSELFGKKIGKVFDFTFEAGEHFSSLSLWKSENENRLGAIKFKTNHSREFFASIKKITTEFPVDVASGICLGIKVHSNEGIYRLGFKFINNIKSVEVKNVCYPTISDVIPKVVFKEIKSMTYQNNTSETQEYRIETSKKITKTSSWSFTDRLDIIFSLNVSAGIPNLVNIQARYELKEGCEGTYASVNTEERMELFSFPVKVPRGKAVDVHITIGQASVVLPFTGKVKVNCYNDSVLQFDTKGTYKSLVYTEAKVVVTESDKNLLSILSIE
ncbi:aerolysin-like protein [Silurus asotus]|uniref:Aerolysin-like protein n=1 Tax=Silurus asotus TaxID=30991 RepID=A0AAD5AUJ3_SILAS|nr:aerolysin-like protein [Silurus asotus]